jgi:hypothetical protein
LSWDIFVQDFPPDASSLADVPACFKPASIGKRSMIIEQIKAVAPLADFSSPSWGTIESDDWSIEINIGIEEECNGFAFHVRGGDTAVGVIAAILQHLRLRAVDSETGDFFSAGPRAAEAFGKWRAYRNRVAND